MELLLHLLLFLPVMLMILFFIPKHRATKKPPGPRGLPIIGNLHQFDNCFTDYLQLWQLSKTYGPLFSLQLGSRPAVVVSSAKIAEQFLKTHDLEVSGRPVMQGQYKLSYDGLNIAFLPSNGYWREIRKVCAIHLFSLKRVTSFSPIRRFEVLQMINKISGQAASSKVTNFTETLMSLICTITCRIAFGKTYEEERTKSSRFHQLLNESEAFVSPCFFVSDYIPFTGWIDKITGLHGRLERNFTELDKFYQHIINDHLDPNRQSDEEDIIDVLLQLKKQNSFPFDLTYRHIKAVIMDILAGGTGTTVAISVWAMVQLMKNARVMNKAQAEIRNLCGKKGFVEEDDIQKLSYFKAVIMETLRIQPISAVVPRETTKKITIDGYEIEDKTMVFVNTWAIHRDPEIWSDPEIFFPERFLNSTIDFKGHDCEFIPFGVGRRICPALHMGVVSVELMLANVLYKFDWEMPPGMKKEDIDTEVLFGFTQYKKNPLYLVAKNYA